MKLSYHFDLDEFTTSQTATRKGIDNSPPADVVANLRVLATTLEHVRTFLGNHSIRISSGYRCAVLNRAIGSDDRSAHVLGYAADFTCPEFGSAKEIVMKIAKSTTKFDQLINEGVTPQKPNGVWVHLSVDPLNRREVLTATFKNGKASYTKGLS